MNTTSILRTATLPIAAAIALAAGAGTAQSQTIIDQAKAMAGNVTPGDAPGFPVTISQPGAYILTGNLQVGYNVNAIVIDAENVTLDLNGFEVRSIGTCERNVATGAVNCTGTHPSDAELSLVSGIRVQARHAVVRNGSIAGFRGNGVHSQAGGLWLDGLRSHSNNVNGVSVAGGVGSRITNSTFSRNQLSGVFGTALLIDGVVASENGDQGLEVWQSVVLRSTARYNNNLGLSGRGLPTAAPTLVRDSSFQSNLSLQGLEVGGHLVSGGGNLANATLF